MSNYFPGGHAPEGDGRIDELRKWIYGEPAVQVSKWGNSLAIRIPAAVAEALELRPGDEVEIHVEA